jgi:hypothetical protein
MCTNIASEPHFNADSQADHLTGAQKPSELPSGRLRIALLEPHLMPIWIDRRPVTRTVQPRHLFRRERPSDRTEILFQLLFVPRQLHGTHGNAPLSAPFRVICLAGGPWLRVSWRAE